MKYASKLLKITNVILMLAYLRSTQKALVPHQYFGNIICHGPKSNDMLNG